ncbi:MAG: hypothetical protein AABX66_00680 [Nanoarchaeota archaeon]
MKNLEKLLLAGALITGISDSSLVSQANGENIIISGGIVPEFLPNNHITNKFGSGKFIYPKDIIIGWLHPIGPIDRIKGYVLYHSTDETNYTDATFVAGTAYNYTFPAQADTHFFVTRPVYNDDSLGGFSTVLGIVGIGQNISIEPGTNYVDVTFEQPSSPVPGFWTADFLQFNTGSSFMGQRDLETTDIGSGRIRKKTRLAVSPTNQIIYNFSYASTPPSCGPIRYLPSSAVMASPDEIRPSPPSKLHKLR